MCDPDARARRRHVLNKLLPAILNMSLHDVSKYDLISPLAYVSRDTSCGMFKLLH